MTIEEIRSGIAKCVACTARLEALIPVPSAGNDKSQIMFVGRNPGRQEDYAGVPFIGRGGKLLDKFIKEANLIRDRLYITNLVKCHTCADRTPDSAEIRCCARLWLLPELSLVRPKLIVGFGSQVSEFFTNQIISKCRLREFIVNCTSSASEALFVAAVHPGAALRSNDYKEQLSEDAAFVTEVIRKYAIPT